MMVKRRAPAAAGSAAVLRILGGPQIMNDGRSTGMMLTCVVTMDTAAGKHACTKTGHLQ